MSTCYQGRGEIGGGGGGRGVMEVGEEGKYVLTLQCQNRNDPSIKIGSDESHFNVS